MEKLVKLKENRDFRRLYGRGKTFVTPLFVVYTMKNKSGPVRLGITAGKKSEELYSATVQNAL